MSAAPVCRTCRAELRWVRLPHGWQALDTGPREPRIGLIALNPAKGTGRLLLTAQDVSEAWAWAYAGATFHPRHADVCPGAGRPRRSPAPGQEVLL